MLELGYIYKDLYDMTIIELENTIENRRKGLAFSIWKISQLCHSPFIKNFPSEPKQACPELYPIEKGIPMPNFLIEKAMKRGVI